nr:DUF3558 domain-containing protein [Actinopolyspora halophila]
MVAGCGPGGLAGDASGGASGETSGAKPSGEVLAGVDPCGILSDAELNSFGLSTSGELTDTMPWRPKCYYEGEPVSLSISKNTRHTVDSSEKRDAWAEFERLKVNGRSAARAITEGSTQSRACDVMFDAGQGMIQVRTQEIRLPDDVDECAKALEIAEKVEPNVPEPA